MVVSSQMPARVTLHLRGTEDEGFHSLEMEPERGHRWAVEVPADWVRPGKLEYCIAVEEGDGVRTYPADVLGEPGAHEFAWPERVAVFVAKEGHAPPEVGGRWSGGRRPSAEIVPGSTADASVLRVSASGSGEEGSGRVQVPLLAEAGLGSLGTEGAPWRGETGLTVRARSIHPETTSFEVGLVERDGTTYARDVPLTPALRNWRFSLGELQPLKGSPVRRGVRLQDVAALHLALGDPSVIRRAMQGQGLDIEAVALEPLLRSWVVPVLRSDAPVTLFEAERDAAHAEYGDRWWYNYRIVSGMSPGRLALLIGRPAHNVWLGDKEVVCRHVFGEDLEKRREHLDRYDTLRLTVRAREEATKQLLVALVQDDGAAWGTVIPLTPDWQEICIPLSALHPMRPAVVPWGFPRPWPYRRETPGQGSGKQGCLLVADVTAVQVLFGPPLCAERAEEAHAIELERVSLEISGREPVE